jgi:cytochrome b561
MSSITADVASTEPGQVERGAFDPITILFHWITVVLLALTFAAAFMIPSGVLLPSSDWLWVHRSAGASVWIVTALRLAWRLLFARFPDFPESMSRLRRALVVASERLLYVLMLIQPAIGVSMSVLRGKPFALLGWEVPTLIAKDLDLSLRLHAAHEACAYALLLCVFLHAARGLFHHYIVGDDLLRAVTLPRKTQE